MSVAITGIATVLTQSGGFNPLLNKFVYLMPSRTDFEFSMNGGTTWQPWEGDPNLITTYPGAISAQVVAGGGYGFRVPWTDSPSEVQLPGGAPVPGLLWNLIDPNSATGVRTIYGATKQAIVGANITTKQLISLPAPDTWQVGSVTYHAVPVGPRRYATVAFTSAGISAAIIFPDIGTSKWRCNFGYRSDDPSKTYSAIIDSTTMTNVSGNIRLSDVPPVGNTVFVDVEIY